MIRSRIDPVCEYYFEFKPEHKTVLKSYVNTGQRLTHLHNIFFLIQSSFVVKPLNFITYFYSFLAYDHLFGISLTTSVSDCV